MGTPANYQCPLCKSSISREIFERVLRIDEARWQEATRERERIKRALAEVQLQREQIERRAAMAETPIGRL